MLDFAGMASAKIFDLAQPYFVGMPHHPSHPPFLFSLVKQHGEYIGPTGNSSASDAIAMGSHVGTHLDGLCHFSCGGKLHGGEEAALAQSYTEGLRKFSVDTIPPIFRRGVLLDMAGLAGSAALAKDFEIGAAHLEKAAKKQAVEIRPGDVVWIPALERHWHGATASSAMTHLAINEKLDGQVVTWMEKVTDEQYHGPSAS